MEDTKAKKKRGLGVRGVIIVILLIVLLFVALIGWITDFMWFREMGYVSVFLTKLFTQLKIGIPVFIIMTFLAYVYLKFLKKGDMKRVESDEETNHRRLNLISWGLAGAFGVVATYFAVTRLWFQTLQFLNSTNFNIRDPLYKNDISFYVFKLNFIEQLNAGVIMLIVTFALLTLVYYMVLLTVRTPRIYEEVEEPGEPEFQEEYTYDDAEEEEEERYTGARMDDNNPFSEINGMFDKFSKQFRSGNGPFGKGGPGAGVKRRQSERASAPAHCPEAADRGRRAVLPDDRRLLLPEAV